MTSQWEGIGRPSQLTDGKDPDSVLFMQTTPKPKVCLHLSYPEAFGSFP